MDLFFCLLLLWCLCSTSQASRSYELSLIGKKASQSKSVVYNTKEANLAIDGDISTFSIAESPGVRQLGRWEVDLGGIYNIVEVSITASINETYAQYLQSFSIWLLKTRIEKKLCSKYSSLKNFKPLETISFKCIQTFPTRYVEIARNENSMFRDDAIALAEVRVKTIYPAAVNLINQMTASSSSNVYHYRDPDNAIDGNKFTYSMSAWEEQESSRGWWEIKFEESYQIGEIIITASLDMTNAKYMQMFSIWLIDEDEAKHICYKYTSKHPFKAGESRSFPCQNYQLLTRRIRIARDGGYRQDIVALAEVQINAIYC